MRIRRIQIKNFRNLKNIEISPSSTTVLIGKNNTGKSNLLYAIRLLLDVNRRRLEAELSEEDINSEALAQGEKEFSIRIEIGNLQDDLPLEAIFRERLFEENNETYITIEGKYEFDEELGYIWNTNLLPSLGRLNDPIPFSDSKAKYIPLYFLSAERNAERDMRPKGRGFLADLLKEIKLEGVKDEISDYIKRANSVLQSDQEIQGLAENISQLLKRHTASGEGEITFNVATDNPVEMVRNLTLGFKRPFDLQQYDMFRHGTGLQNLALISIFRFVIAQTETIFPILAIEEPEAHLHPLSQICLFKELDMIKNPVLITTHSPNILNHVDPLKIILLKESATGKITSHQLNRNSINETDIKSFSKFIRLGSSYALFSKVIIIVEGYSEAILLPLFADALNANIYRDCISIVPAYGGSFSFLMNICKDTHFSIPIVITYDTDVLENNNNLLNEAYKAGLLSRALRDSWSSLSDPSSERQRVLESLGWISVNHNLEEELGNAGYFDLILQFLNHQGVIQTYNNFLITKNLDKDAYSIGLFINKHKDLKVPLAYFLADEVPIKKFVPICFKIAIENAVNLSTGG